MSSKRVAVMVGLVACVGLGLLALRRKGADPGPAEAAESAPSPAPAPVPPALPSPPAPPSPPVAPVAAVPAASRDSSPPASSRSPGETEAALMTRLRELGASDPTRTLELARKGDRQFKDGPDAAERSWMIVKALMEMGRVDDARAEARVMVERYRGTSWAADVHRHMFVNPPTDPSERGFGKTNELD